jgi:hypothetical protein
LQHFSVGGRPEQINWAEIIAPAGSHYRCLLSTAVVAKLNVTLILTKRIGPNMAIEGDGGGDKADRLDEDEKHEWSSWALCVLVSDMGRLR